MEQLARMIGDQPVIIIFDEFSYAAESDPSLPSHVQAAWDVMRMMANQHLASKPVPYLLAPATSEAGELRTPPALAANDMSQAPAAATTAVR